MAPPRVLIVLPESPYPPRAGNAWRDAQHVAILARVGWEPVLALAANRRDLSTDDETRRLAGMTFRRGQLVRHERRPLWSTARLKMAYALRSTQNPFAWWLDSADLNAFAVRAVAETEPDAIILRSLFVHTIPAIRRTFSGRLVVDCHDADEHLARELLESSHGIRKVGPWANWRGVRGTMIRFLPEADEVWAASDDDADRIIDLVPRASVLTVRTGLERVAAPRDRPGDARTVLMVANYGYGPNAEGALWLIRHVWPAVSASVPDARLVLAGNGGPRQLARAAASTRGVELRGLVNDLAPLYEDAAVVVAPIRTGGGTRVKIIEAWRYGKAVVTTRKGGEGLPIDPDSVIVTDQAHEFAAATTLLLGDTRRRQRLGQRALRLFDTFLSYEAIAAALPWHWRLTTYSRPSANDSHRLGCAGRLGGPGTRGAMMLG
jgi:polysaccharide biosynthesis protein PslH